MPNMQASCRCGGSYDVEQAARGRGSDLRFHRAGVEQEHQEGDHVVNGAGKESCNLRISLETNQAKWL